MKGTRIHLLRNAMYYAPIIIPNAPFNEVSRANYPNLLDLINVNTNTITHLITHSNYASNWTIIGILHEELHAYLSKEINGRGTARLP